MNSPIIQLLVLAGIAVFLILRLKNVLGTREGFEKPPAPAPSAPSARKRPEFEVIEGGPDLDIADHTEGMPEAAEALAQNAAGDNVKGTLSAEKAEQNRTSGQDAAAIA